MFSSYILKQLHFFSATLEIILSLLLQLRSRASGNCSTKHQNLQAAAIKASSSSPPLPARCLNYWILLLLKSSLMAFFPRGGLLWVSHTPSSVLQSVSTEYHRSFFCVNPITVDLVTPSLSGEVSNFSKAVLRIYFWFYKRRQTSPFILPDLQQQNYTVHKQQG